MTEEHAERARRRRARERRDRFTVARVRRDQIDPDEAPIRGLAGMELSARLTRAAWALSGLPWPTYSREETPYAFVPNFDRT